MQQVIIQASFVKDDGTLFLILNFFSKSPSYISCVEI